MAAFWIASFLVFMAEMADKTQLVVMAFAAKYSAWTVASGVFAAVLVMQLISVTIGEAIASVIPIYWDHILSGPLSGLASGRSEAMKMTATRRAATRSLGRSSRWR